MLGAARLPVGEGGAGAHVLAVAAGARELEPALVAGAAGGESCRAHFFFSFLVLSLFFSRTWEDGAREGRVGV